MSADPKALWWARPSSIVSEKAKRPRAKRGTRQRKAHWRGELRGVVYHFAFEPKSQVIRVRKARSRKTKTITMTELLQVLEGQHLLPLDIA